MDLHSDGRFVCPKCRRPIEGDEEYICCATATLAWRCTDCGKVSEGLAFPYGLCPYCSSKLEVLDPQQITDVDGLRAIRAAFEIELGGRAFYASAAREANKPVLKTLFGKFAAMEDEHMATLTQRYHADPPDPVMAFQVDRAALYAGVDNCPEDPGNLFRIAIAFEQRAVAFFSRESEQALEGSIQRQLYKELAAEENEHVALLTTEYERWKLGKPALSYRADVNAQNYGPAMQLSARNIFKGKVVDVTTGPLMAKVRVDIGSGNIVTAIVTADSTSALGVNIGDEISVVIKATEVMLAK